MQVVAVNIFFLTFSCRNDNIIDMLHHLWEYTKSTTEHFLLWLWTNTRKKTPWKSSVEVNYSCERTTWHKTFRNFVYATFNSQRSIFLRFTIFSSRIRRHSIFGVQTGPLTCWGTNGVVTVWMKYAETRACFATSDKMEIHVFLHFIRF